MHRPPQLAASWSLWISLNCLRVAEGVQPGSYMLRCMGPVLAQMRSADRARQCLLQGLDRTYRGRHETDAFDPKATSHAGLRRPPSRLQPWL